MSYQLLQDPDNPRLPATPNIPIGGLLQSGGGIANHVHGGPGAVYSREAERKDVFGYSVPRNDKTYGNMYGNGPSFLENIQPMTPNTRAMQFDYPYAWDHGGAYAKAQKYYPTGIGGGMSSQGQQFAPQQNIENFNIDDSTPLDYGSTSEPVGSTSVIDKPSIMMVFIILIILFIAIEMWTHAFTSVLQQYIFKKEKLTIGNWVVMAVLITLLFFAVIYFGEYKFEWF